MVAHAEIEAPWTATGFSVIIAGLITTCNDRLFYHSPTQTLLHQPSTALESGTKQELLMSGVRHSTHNTKNSRQKEVRKWLPVCMGAFINYFTFEFTFAQHSNARG